MIYYKINPGSWCNWQYLLISFKVSSALEGGPSTGYLLKSTGLSGLKTWRRQHCKRLNKICKRLMIKIKIIADGDCSQQIKRCFLLGRKAMINLDIIIKNRDITLPTKVCKSKLLFLQWPHTNVRGGPWGKLCVGELMFLNCGAGEDFWESPLAERRSNLLTKEFHSRS